MSVPEDLREELVSSVWAFEGRLVRVRVDEVRLPGGGEARREVLVHPGAVAIVPLHEDGTVTMVRQWRQAAGKALLEIPAGTLDPGENPEACAHRELAEEVGLGARRMTCLFSSYLAPGYSSELLHTFVATDLVPASGEPDADETLVVDRIALDRAVPMVLDGTIEDAKTICGLLLADRWRRAAARE